MNASVQKLILMNSSNNKDINPLSMLLTTDIIPCIFSLQIAGIFLMFSVVYHFFCVNSFTKLMFA